MPIMILMEVTSTDEEGGQQRKLSSESERTCETFERRAGNHLTDIVRFHSVL
jgi:hypothetical protein